MISCLNRRVFKNLLFEGVKSSELESLDFNNLEYRKYSSGETMIKEGEYGDFMLLIIDGTVSVSKTINDIEVQLGFKEAGDYVGEMALFDGEKRSASVVANTPVEAYSLDINTYNYITEKYPIILNNIIKGITRTLRSNGVKITSDREKFIAEIKNIRELLNQTLELKRTIDEQKLELELINRELEKKNRELYRLTIFDELTGAYSKKHFNQLLDNELAKSVGNNFVFSVLVLDIDEFKSFNDTYGHILGDKVLVKIVEVITSHLRKEDIVGRLGGEEFGIILPYVTVDDAVALGEKIKNYLSENELVIDLKPLKVCVSIGVTDNIIGFPNSVEEILYNGDIALYKAKNRGRNRVEKYYRGLTMNSVLSH